MKIMTWNCNIVFRKKAKYIFPHNPDILIIPECENQEELKFEEELKIPNDIIWYGKNQNKGIGVFAFGNYKLKLLDCHNPDFKKYLANICD